jgi:hypothetical protein
MAAIVFATKVIKKINYNKTPPVFATKVIKKINYNKTPPFFTLFVFYIIAYVILIPPVKSLGFEAKHASYYRQIYRTFFNFILLKKFPARLPSLRLATLNHIR